MKKPSSADKGLFMLGSLWADFVTAGGYVDRARVFLDESLDSLSSAQVGRDGR